MRNSKGIDEIFIKKNSLRDTNLDEILINKDENQELQITLIFSKFNQKSDFETAKIIFRKIKEFSFSYNSDYNFYTVESYKLLNLEGEIYISLDPDESTNLRSSKDLDFILSEIAIVN